MRIINEHQAELIIAPPPSAIVLSTDLGLPAIANTDVKHTLETLDNPEKNLSKLDIFDLLQILIDGKWLPEHIPTVEAAFTIRQMGLELGIPTMQAFHNIIPIKGKLTLSAVCKSALIRRGGVIYTVLRDAEYMYNEGGGQMDFTKFPKYRTGSEDWTNKYMGRVTTIKAFRVVLGERIEQEVSFSTLDAMSMGLMEKDNWVRMLPQMLLARCVSKLSVMFAADLILNLPTTEEIIEDSRDMDYNYNDGKLNVIQLS
jgi:hypothetical protein